MSIWSKLQKWAKRDKSKDAPVPDSRKPTEGPSYEQQFASPTKKYASPKWRAAARRLHKANRRERLKDPKETHRQKLKKLGLS